MKIVHAFAIVAALAGGTTAVLAGDECCGGKGAKTAENKTEIKQITTEELAKALEEKKVVVLDVNSAERFAQGHIPTAKHVTQQVTAADLPADKAAALVFYCGSEKCGASMKAAKNAVALGYTNVSIYKPGIAGWETAKQPTEKGAPAATPTAS